MTPPRPSDIVYYPLIVNDPRVYEWLIGLSFPYLREHGEAWYAIIKQPIDAVLAELDAAKVINALVTVNKCPVRTIRKALDNGEDIYLGEIGFDRPEDGKLLAPLDVEVDKKLASGCVHIIFRLLPSFIAIY
ncbi:hypothetical protein BDZ94DRAFT_1243001 [Collybia nuda]|uniref:Uncharacterized protein n=1 Tax=Collybia nuda TaxID=64659 RepID=A0A9P5YJE2_9AGAR|nr:hypothetical protein BDZ94DRAFT_1243001 [Collybia nuda]